MNLTAAAPAELIGATTPLARNAELHSMEMEGTIMKMRPLTSIPLPPRQAVRLKPGGNHVMLVDIKRPLKPGEHIPLKLLIRDRSGRNTTVPVLAEVRSVSESHSH